MKRYQKIFGKVCRKEVFVMKVLDSGQYGMELTDYEDGKVTLYKDICPDFRSAGMWAFNMANNGDIGRRVNEWMCEKTGLVFWED